MPLFTWLAISSYLLAFVILAAFAVIYLTRTQFMPYHRDAVARPWSDLDPRLQVLLMALIRIVGWAWLALACAGLMLLYGVFFVSSGLLQLISFQGFCLLMITPAIVVTTRVRRQTGAKPPTLTSALVALLTVVGFVFALLAGHHT
ncbi:hypothetical protein [Pseudomonas sp. H9]|uniref:hypothetical protein n=1 Tax=Pseudomonas sp. H9 TaxID=483968 RepID=UPI0010581A2C|nr:hypothetical protein [Pseudomonas sp. H9]TDF80818.1 hypothetical protein E1573_19220 [Pseudomonas sp. H9]